MRAKESCWSFSASRARELLAATVSGSRPLRSLLLSHAALAAPADAPAPLPPPVVSSASPRALRLLCLICSDLGEPRAFLRSLSAAGSLRALLLGGSVFSFPAAPQTNAAAAAAENDGAAPAAPAGAAAPAAAPPPLSEAEARRAATAAVAEALGDVGALLPSLVALEVSCCCPSDPTARAAAWLPWLQEQERLGVAASLGRLACFGPDLVGEPGRPAVWDLFDEGSAAALAAAGAGRLAAALGLDDCAAAADLGAALAAAASAVRARDGRRMSMLHHAALSGSAPHAAALLALGARPDYRNAAGSTALFLAAEQGSQPVVEALLRGGAKIPVPNNAGENPLYISALTGREGAVKALLRHCGAPGGLLREVGGPDGWSPLHAAAVAGRERILRVILQAAAHAGEGEMRALLDARNRYGAHESAVPGVSRPPETHLAARWRARRPERDAHCGAEGGGRDVLHAGWCASPRRPLGSCLRETASETNPPKPARAGAGAACNLRDERGQTPADVASSHGHRALSAWLRQQQGAAAGGGWAARGAAEGAAARAASQQAAPTAPRTPKQKHSGRPPRRKSGDLQRATPPQVAPGPQLPPPAPPPAAPAAG